MEQIYLIWSNQHKAWWRPERRGYTTSLNAAGRYPRSEAIKICTHSRYGWDGKDHPSEIPVAEDDVMACKAAFDEVMHPTNWGHLK